MDVQMQAVLGIVRAVGQGAAVPCCMAETAVSPGVNHSTA